MRLRSDDSSYLWSHLREDFLNRLIHDKFAINEASESLEGVPFPIYRVNDDHVFFCWVKGNSICTAPFMDASATNVHVTLDRFIFLSSLELLEYGEVIRKKNCFFCGNTMSHIAEEDVPQRGA